MIEPLMYGLGACIVLLIGIGLGARFHDCPDPECDTHHWQERYGVTHDKFRRTKIEDGVIKAQRKVWERCEDCGTGRYSWSTLKEMPEDSFHNIHG